MMAMVSSQDSVVREEIFIPHTLEHLIEAKVFPSSLPQEFYNKICREYSQITDAVTSRITYLSDGLKITGLSCLPAETGQGKHPIYIYNRGGYREYGKLTVLSVMRSMLPFAQAGYLTYASNYRGNDGGEGKDEFGGQDINDIANLIELAKSNSAWDKKNIFILGHSRGGMMTYQTLKNNRNITAAISLAGISDLGERETSRFKNIMDGLNLTSNEDYQKRSAINWAESIKTPLLLIHGTSDEAISHENSEILAAKLKELGNPHELVIIEGGNHALVRHWPQVIEKALAWLEEYRI